MVQFIRSLRRFLWRAICDLPRAIGSNPLGVLFPILPAILFFTYQALQSGVQAVKHDLFVGTIITAISYVLLLTYCVVRNLYREHRALVARAEKLQSELDYIQNCPPWTGYDSEQQWRDSIDEQNRLVTLGHKFDGLLSDSQIEAIRIAKELRKALSDNPAPYENPGASVTTAQLAKTEEWRLKLLHFYRHDFAERVSVVQSSVGKADPRTASYLDPFMGSGGIQNGQDIEDLIKTLWAIASDAKEVI